MVRPTGTTAPPDRPRGRGVATPPARAASNRDGHSVAASFLHHGLLIAALAATLVGLSGCYKRVVGVKGDGYQGPVYEANLPPGERNLVVELFETKTTRTSGSDR